MNKKLERILKNVGDLNFRRRIVEIFNYLDIKPGDKILDCGCGDGFYTMILSEVYDCKVTAMDYKQKLIDSAKKSVRNLEKVKFVIGDITKGLPFEDNTFDKVIFTEVLEHLNDEQQALEELKRVLKKGGKLALSVPHCNYPFLWDPFNWVREHLGLGHFNPMKPLLGGVWGYDHKRLYSPDMLKEVVSKSELEVNKIIGLTHHTLPFNLTLLYIGKQVYTALFSRSKSSGIEKFDWDKEKKRNLVVESLFNFAKKVDSKNEGKDYIGKKSFITLFCGATK
ncbi:class I SAM-dependent methyltransferase [Patescibacteria group bacterium]